MILHNSIMLGRKIVIDYILKIMNLENNFELVKYSLEIIEKNYFDLIPSMNKKIYS